jgi:hypothetical protein
MTKSTKLHTGSSAPPKRRFLGRGFLLAVAAFATAYWFWNRQDAHAQMAYAARSACSCHYLADRELDSCEADFPAGMGQVILSSDDSDKAVTAWLPLFGSDTARYAEGSGCVLDSWDE